AFANFRSVEILFGPRSLQRHAKLAARDLLFERFDVGVLLEEKIRDARDDSSLVAPDDGDSGEFFHISKRGHEFFANGFGNFARRTGTFDNVAPTEVRGVGVLRDQSLLLRGGIDLD